MRKLTFSLLLLFAFAIPWEYSLDWGEPWGNIARVLGLAVLLSAAVSMLFDRQIRRLGATQWLVLALYLWICCTCLWSVDPTTTLHKLLGNFQEMMIVWLLWELVETPRQLRLLLGAFVAGSCLLAVLTFVDFGSAEAIAANQIRFVAGGHDPNDAARLLALAIPLATLLSCTARSWQFRPIALAYLPLGLFALLLTGSREGLLCAIVAIATSLFILLRTDSLFAKSGAVALLLLIVVGCFVLPPETYQRLATTPAQLQAHDLNQRWIIWDAGWHAFTRAPWFGSGIGGFPAAAATNPLDTAHNTALSLLVGGGMVALSLAIAVLACALKGVLSTTGLLKTTLAGTLLVWFVGSLAGTVEENRATWLLLGLAAAAGRLAVDDRNRLRSCFSPAPVQTKTTPAARPAFIAD